MIRPFLLALMAAALGLIGWQLMREGDRIAVTDAVAVPAEGPGDLWMVEMTLANAGPPDRLLGFEGDAARLVNAGAPGMAVVLPGGDEAQLAMDGTHGMLLSREAPGALVPLTLLFERAGRVRTRVRLSDGPIMEHGAMPGIAEEPSPTLALSVPGGVRAEGFALALKTERIAFRQVPEGTGHVAGEGHAHVYLNGLKLGRAYAETFGVGPLLPGLYRLRVVLNAHDHRPYLAGGAPVEAVLEFAVE
jgi:copper(I)-binding protein